MKIDSSSIIPITKARGRLGDLANRVRNENYIILTKDGSPKAALVDLSYLTRLEEEVRKAYQKTFIDKTLLPYTREFTDEELKEWEKEDTL